MFLKLSHKSSQSRRRKRGLSAPPHPSPPSPPPGGLAHPPLADAPRPGAQTSRLEALAAGPPLATCFLLTTLWGAFAVSVNSLFSISSSDFLSCFFSFHASCFSFSLKRRHVIGCGLERRRRRRRLQIDGRQGARLWHTQGWEEAQKELLSTPIHHPWALITQWWRMHRTEEERVLDDRRECALHNKSNCVVHCEQLSLHPSGGASYC